ncbi:tetratricopeptide repeat protein [Fontivita pretiosa]|uniref:O-linked N-acetylglucosamine transferase, SPINDLY family protein n=1 Tax=Fontivita pretiosa TaxID=2989684 RepID=UPI003D17C5F1
MGIEARSPHFLLQSASGHLARGELPQAEALCRQALKSKPTDADALALLGRVLVAGGRSREAVEVFRQAVTLRRSSAELRYALGDALYRIGSLQEAESAYRKALELQPGLLAARVGLGEVEAMLGRTEQAIAHWQAVLRMDPGNVAAMVSLGSVLSMQGRHGQAIEQLGRAVQIDPRNPAAHQNLGVALSLQGRLDEAVAAFREALRLRPNWAKAHSNLLFLLTYHLEDPAALYAAHLEYARIHADPLASEIQPHPNDRSPDRKLKIAYISQDFRQHPVAIFIEPILRHHNRANFEVYCYSDVASPDATSERLQSLADHWVDVRGVNNRILAEMLRQERIDILIDLTAHSNGGKRMGLLARKPAPVQVSYLGYAGTTGLGTVDWRITDVHIDPPGLTDAYNSERLARLPRTQWVYCPPQPCPDVAPLPARQRGFVTFGSANRLDKITSRVLRLWSQVLMAVPSARMSIKARGLDDEPTRKRILEAMAAGGVEAARIDLIGWSDFDGYLRYFNEVDIILDAYPFAGGTTSCHALWMGAPVVTRTGRTPVSRVGASLLHNVALTDLIGESDEQYVKIASELAGNLDRLAEIRASLRRRMQQSPLCDVAGFIDDLESAYRQMWHEWCTHGGAAG